MIHFFQEQPECTIVNVTGIITWDREGEEMPFGVGTETGSTLIAFTDNYFAPSVVSGEIF